MEWGAYRPDPGRTGSVDAHLAGTPQVAWTFQTAAEKPFGVWTTPLVADGLVVVGDARGTIYALREATGAEAWRFLGDASGFQATPAADAQRIYAASRHGPLYALDRSGHAVWTATIGNDTLGSLLLDGGRLYVPSGAALVRVEPETGRVVWRFGADSAIQSSPASDGRNTVFGTLNGHLDAVGLDNGTLAWSRDVGEALEGGVLVHAGRAIVATEQGTVRAFDAATGRPAWSSAPLGDHMASTPTLAAGRVCIGVGQGVDCLDEASGRLLLRAEAPHASGTAAPRVYRASGLALGDQLVLGFLDGEVKMLNVTDGSWTWRHATGADIAGSPSYHDGRLFLGSRDGVVYAFQVVPAPASHKASASGFAAAVVAILAGGLVTGRAAHVFRQGRCPAAGKRRL